MTPINANDFLIPEIFRVYSRLPAVAGDSRAAYSFVVTDHQCHP